MNNSDNPGQTPPEEAAALEKDTNASSKPKSPNAWKAGRKPSKTAKVNRGDNEGGALAIRADEKLMVPERDDPAYKKFSEMVGGKEGLKELASWSENPKAQKLISLLDDKKFETYGIKALAKRCGMTLPELCNLFREKHFLEVYLTFFQGVPQIAKGAVDDASPSQDVCPICSGAGTIKRDGYQVKCPKCRGSGEVRISGDKEARRDVFKAVGIIKDSAQIVNQQIGTVNIEGVDDFESLMKKATTSAKKIEVNEQVQEAEIID